MTGNHTGWFQKTKKELAKLKKIWYKYIVVSYDMDGFPSGQRGQTVNLLQIASVVRIHLHPLTCYCIEK